MARTPGANSGGGGNARGFTLSHQHVALELRFDGIAEGYSELTIVPTDPDLKTMHVNCRQADIRYVTVNSQPTSYAYNDLLSNVTLSNDKDVHLYPELKRKLFAAASDGSNGELSIAISPDVGIQTLKERVEAEQESKADALKDTSMNGSALRGQSNTQEQGPSENSDKTKTANRESKVAEDAGREDGAQTEDEYAPLKVRIYYSLRHPLHGLQFVKATPDAPYRIPHIYSTPSCADWSRCWTPCLDSLWERCTWQLDFVVPRYLTPAALGESTSDDEEDVADNDADEVVVVCSGDLVEKTVHPHCPSKIIFSYEQAAPTSVQHIAFAIGPFSMHTVASPSKQTPKSITGSNPNSNSNSTDAAADDCSPQVIGFCFPGREEEMQHSIGFTRQAFDFVSRDYGSYPFGSFKMVFVDEPINDCHAASTIAICSTDLLHPPRIVDQAYETHHVLSHAIVFQWIGINVTQRSWADMWLIHGISLHITSLFLRRIWGNNEYRLRLRKDMERLVAWDIGMPPLFQAGMTEPPDPAFLPFLNLKAPLVLFILDRRLSKVSASLGLSRAINKIFLDALTGELQGSVLSTSHFLRQCRKLGGVDLTTFTEQWIYGSGCPRFSFTAAFNRKKLIIEMTIRQDCPAANFAMTNPSDAIYSNPIEKFEGQITVRIHEADGTPYEHVIDIDSHEKRIDVPFNTKYKRVRRNTKRFQARKEAAAAAAAGDEEAREAMGLIDLGFVYGQWEDDSEREAWQVADWTEQEELDMSSAPYEWIRVDPDCEWLALIHFQQEPWMWISQLERDRDVIAQLCAVNALAQMPSKVVSSILCRTVLVEKYFFRIRVEAAHALVNCAVPTLEYLGLFHLLKLFQSRYCHQQPPDYEAEGPLDMLLIPKANDFSDLPEYFLRRAILHAISRVRNEHGRPLSQVKRFLVNVLRYNDNSSNRFGDDFYIAGLINTIAAAYIPADYNLNAPLPLLSAEEREADALLLQAAVNEIERCRELDMLVPSYHNIISIAALDFHLATMMANLRPVDLQLFFAYTRQGNYASLRAVAFNSLVLMRGLQHKVVARYLFEVLRCDESRVVRRTLARAMLESLAASVATNEYGELKARTMFIEGDAATAASEAERAREQDLDNVLRTLRREVGRSAAIREGFMAALLSPTVDSEARWALLKLAELLFKPAAETDLPFLPKVSVHVRTLSMSGAAELDTPSTEGFRLKLVRSAAEPTPATEPSASTPRVAFDVTQEKVLPKFTLKPKKPKKAKPAAPEQASGMSTMDVTACRNCLKKLFESRHAPLFLNPVDPVRDQAPNYFEVISEPMDLNSIMNKLNAGMYKDRFDFKSDFELLVRNAKTYTPNPEAYVHQEAAALEKDFNRHWNRITRTLEQAEAKHHKQTEASEGMANGASIAAAAPAQEERQAPTAAAASVPAPAPPLATAAPPPPAQSTRITTSMPPPIHIPSASPAPSLPTTKASGSGLGLKLKLKPKVSVSGGSAPAPTSVATPPKEIKLKLKSATPVSERKASPAPAAAAVAARVPSTKGTSSPAPSPAPAKALSKAPSPAPPKANAMPAASSDPVAAAGKEPMNSKRCKSLLQTMKRMSEAAFFLRPVDPVKDGVPTYYDEIKHPMDFGTMEKKLNDNAYSRMSEFAADMQLVFGNARTFNPVGTLPHNWANVCEQAFHREWAKALVPRLEYVEKRALQGLLTRLKANVGVSGIFLHAVDPVALGIPHYHDVIPKADARDLGLIENKLKGDRYGSMRAFTEDVQLMVQNARTFNAGDDGVLTLIDAFERLYKKELSGVRSALSSAGGGGGGASSSSTMAGMKRKSESNGGGSGASASHGAGDSHKKAKTS
ncbi:hypothetical protein K437DRAFT_258484 [Tilletiaria anomala UBC 951]|uniref:Transcription initiation factor TFIID subunit 2 n=1 Tax=Tilletiaria anomala (strain ATCC 24038 / CBS 436.72 / UBC 951) TaxID=1037660 RepID=A0A066VQB6_TILAU|nr:uncharacterized protein K437DRAFT_258484 [Tilletiaria anomala UBC 951]KDN40979.1 hypothetical protein K437DRAFT_258484 [Tilletiaria anomala UBC 951]